MNSASIYERRKGSLACGKATLNQGYRPEAPLELLKHREYSYNTKLRLPVKRISHSIVRLIFKVLLAIIQH